MLCSPCPVLIRAFSSKKDHRFIDPSLWSGGSVDGKKKHVASATDSCCHVGGGACQLLPRFHCSVGTLLQP